MTMHDPKAALSLQAATEENDSPTVKEEGRTRRQTPSRMRSKSRPRSSPRRTQSAHVLSPSATSTTRSSRIAVARNMRDTLTVTDLENQNEATATIITAAERKSPRRVKSANVVRLNGAEHTELLELAKLQAAQQGGVDGEMTTENKSQVRLKVTVRRKKDGTTEMKKIAKVPSSSKLDLSQFDNEQESPRRKMISSGALSLTGFNPNNLEKLLDSSKGTATLRGRQRAAAGGGGDDDASTFTTNTTRTEVFHREGRARSRSRASRHRAASRGRPSLTSASSRNVSETNDDSDDDDHETDERDCVVDDIIQNRREQGLIADLPSPALSSKHRKTIGPPPAPKTPVSNNRSPSNSKSKKAYSCLSDDSTSGATPKKLSPVRSPIQLSPIPPVVVGERTRFTEASEWSTVVDDLLQKRRSTTEAETVGKTPSRRGLLSTVFQGNSSTTADNMSMGTNGPTEQAIIGAPPAPPIETDTSPPKPARRGLRLLTSPKKSTRKLMDVES